MKKRKARRRLIREIEAATGRILLCYVSLERPITPSDTFDLIRLLDMIESGASITLLLDSPGGMIDPAEKMVHLLREACRPPSGSDGGFEVVVPDQAKSAATLMALGADRIVMSDSSELGPIDPQVQYSNSMLVPAFALLRACEEAEQRCAEHPDNPVFADAFREFDPVEIAMAKQAITRARTCAENLLKKQGGNYTAAPALLINVDRFPSHGQMIDWRTAKEIGIPQVDHLDRRSPLWQQYWRLYRQLSLVCGAQGRVFESRDLTILERDSAENDPASRSAHRLPVAARRAPGRCARSRPATCSCPRGCAS